MLTLFSCIKTKGMLLSLFFCSDVLPLPFVNMWWEPHGGSHYPGETWVGDAAGGNAKYKSG